MSTRSLPTKPSLEHLRKQAKRLVKSTAGLSLQQAQHRLAVEYGFADWKALRDDVHGRSVQDRLVRHLGAPVPMPEDLDPRYRPDALQAFVERLARETACPLKRLAVDESEYPPLVGAVLETAEDYGWLGRTVERLGGGDYAYNGCASSRDRGELRFALNVIPSVVIYERPDAQRISNRLMLRLETLREELA